MTLNYFGDSLPSDSANLQTYISNLQHTQAAAQSQIDKEKAKDTGTIVKWVSIGGAGLIAILALVRWS
jgi:hypothetical protein